MPKPKFRVGQKVDVLLRDRWFQGSIAFIWRAVEMDSDRRIFCYDVNAQTETGPYRAIRIAESFIRRKDGRRGRPRVLRAHSVRWERFT